MATLFLAMIDLTDLKSTIMFYMNRSELEYKIKIALRTGLILATQETLTNSEDYNNFVQVLTSIIMESIDNENLYKRPNHRLLQ